MRTGPIFLCGFLFVRGAGSFVVGSADFVAYPFLSHATESPVGVAVFSPGNEIGVF